MGWALLEALDPRRSAPWTWLTIAGLAGLALVDRWRGLAEPCCALLRGVLPNVLAVPVIAFALLAFQFGERMPDSAERRHAQRRRFGITLGIAVIGIAAWEFVQRGGGNLVFDPLDLVATAVGGVLALALFALLEPFAFQHPESGDTAP